jgi:hypothetical protein
MKRKWEEFTGVPVPKLLKTSDFIDNELVANATRVNFVPKIQTSVIEEVVEEEEEEQQQQTIIPSTNSMMIPAISSSEQAAFAAPSQTMPPHPDDKIDVDNMVVNDLRKELKKRQLATAGRKAELQDRLREYLAEATLQRETAWASKFAATDVVPAEKVVQTKHVQISDNVDAMDVVMEDEIAGMPMVTNTTSEEIQSVSVVKKEEVMKSEARNPGVSREPVMEPVVATLSSSTLLAAAKKQAPKSALKPSKYHSSVIECAAQLPTTKPASESATKSFVRDASPRPIPTKISNSSTESSTSSSAVPSSAIKATYQLQTSVSKYLNASSSLVHTTPGTTVSRTGGATSATLLQKRQETAAAKEARDAQNRLRTEMRNKVCINSCVYFII